MPQQRVHVFQHVPFEGLGSIHPWLLSHKSEIRFTRFYANDSLPAITSFDTLIVLGGPMSVHDEKEFPWLRQEKECLRAAIEAEKVVLGICLGAQLIATVLGAQVYKNTEKEIGWFPLHTTSSCQLPLPEKFMAFHWHGETFTLPQGALLLASTETTPHQAFLWKSHVLALQFHLEATQESVDTLLAHCKDDLVPAPFTQPTDILRHNSWLYAEDANRLMEKILTSLLTTA